MLGRQGQHNWFPGCRQQLIWDLGRALEGQVDGDLHPSSLANLDRVMTQPQMHLYLIYSNYTHILLDK